MFKEFTNYGGFYVLAHCSNCQEATTKFYYNKSHGFTDEEIEEHVNNWVCHTCEATASDDDEYPLDPSSEDFEDSYDDDEDED